MVSFLNENYTVIHMFMYLCIYWCRKGQRDLMSKGRNNCQNIYTTSIYISMSQAKYLSHLIYYRFQHMKVLLWDIQM